MDSKIHEFSATRCAAERIAEHPLVTLVLCPETGDPVDAIALLRSAPGGSVALRNAVEEARLRGDEGYRCVVCRQPLVIRGSAAGGPRGLHWSHLSAAERCPLSEGQRCPPDVLRAAMYMGRQESRAHQDRKRWLGRSLAADPMAGAPEFERVVAVWKARHGEETCDREWRKPDVRVVYNFGTAEAPRLQELVFEIQLSNTFLTDIVGRRTFHWERRVPLIWVMDRFDMTSSLSKHDCFVPNGRNTYVVDEETLALSEATGRCMLRAIWVVEGRYESDIVPLSALQIDWERKRVIYKDGEAIERAEREARERARWSWEGRRLRRAAAAVPYTDADKRRGKLVSAMDALLESGATRMGGTGFQSRVEFGHHLCASKCWHDLACLYVAVADLVGLTPALESEDPTGRWRGKAAALRALAPQNPRLQDLLLLAAQLHPQTVGAALQRARASGRWPWPPRAA